jgi:hypothetical protein
LERLSPAESGTGGGTTPRAGRSPETFEFRHFVFVCTATVASFFPSTAGIILYPAIFDMVKA